MATPSCFADLSRQEIAGLVEEKDSKDTQSATKTAVTVVILYFTIIFVISFHCPEKPL